MSWQDRLDRPRATHRHMMPAVAYPLRSLRCDGADPPYNLTSGRFEAFELLPMTMYTRQGDDGTTGLRGGERVPKDDVRIAACGELDEVNAVLGWAGAACSEDDTVQALRQIQWDLLNLGAELAAVTAPEPRVNIDENVRRLEQWIDEVTAELEPLKGFILPGGGGVAARFQVARTVCRRAERAVVRLSREHGVRGAVLAYVNRLSDLLFVLARRANARAGVAEVHWDGAARPNP